MFSLRLLGTVEVEAPDGSTLVQLMGQREPVSLLSFLGASPPNQFHPRRKLEGLLWSKETPGDAPHRLNRALQELRHNLGEDSVLSGRGGEIALNDRAFSVDVRQFDEAVQTGNLEIGLELYRGEFLARFFTPDAPAFESWADEERSRLRRAAIDAALQVVRSYDERGEYYAAVERARWTVGIAPAEETVLQQLLQLLDAHGDRTMALREFETFRDRLASDFGSEPSKETLALVRRIRETQRFVPGSERVDVSEGRPEREHPGPGEAAQGDTLLERLRPLWAERYDVQRKIGSGGMATVYLARDVEDDRRVAIKVLRPEVADLVGTERFLREIRIGASLQHPNVLPLYDSGEVDGLPFYVMPYVTGGSLKDRLRREKQLPIDEALRITREVAGALEFAHEREILHRDIKPANILLEGDTPLIADFGIARALSEVGEDKLTVSGIAVGTPGYMSPEQATATPDVDHRTDIYSLACVLHEMLAGEMVFTGSSARAIVAKHVAVAPTPVRALRPRVPEGVEQAILCALEKTPVDRCGTMREFAAALEEGTVAVPARLDPRRSRVRRAVAVGVLLILTAGVGGALSNLWIQERVVDSRGESSGPVPDPSRVAVLYFEDTSNAGEGTNLAAGLTRNLISQLHAVDALTVTSSRGVRPYRGSDITPDSIARALGVGTLVDGSVQRADDRVHVYVELLEASTGEMIGTTTLDRAQSEFFALQEELASEIQRFLRVHLGQEIEVLQLMAETGNLEAFELVQRSLDLIEEARETDRIQGEDALETTLARLALADSLLAEAELRDPSWIEPKVHRGWVAWNEARFVSDLDSARAAEALERGLNQADAALAVAPSDARGLLLRGNVRHSQAALGLGPIQRTTALEWAEEDLIRALEAEPSYAEAWAALSHVFWLKGDFAESERAAENATAEDEFLELEHEAWLNLYHAALGSERFVEAGQYCESGAREFPNEWGLVQCQLSLMAYAPRDPPDAQRAWQLFDRLQDLGSESERSAQRMWRYAFVAAVLAREGLADSARTVMDRALADANNADDRTDLAYEEAHLSLLLGEETEAIRHLERFLSANPLLRDFISNDFIFRPLQDDARFQALLNEE